MPYSKIRLLDISNNKITDRGLAYIFHTLKKPYVMQLFYIWGNSFGLKTNKVIKPPKLYKEVLHYKEL